MRLNLFEILLFSAGEENSVNEVRNGDYYDLAFSVFVMGVIHAEDDLVNYLLKICCGVRVSILQTRLRPFFNVMRIIVLESVRVLLLALVGVHYLLLVVLVQPLQKTYIDKVNDVPLVREGEDCVKAVIRVLGDAVVFS